METARQEVIARIASLALGLAFSNKDRHDTLDQLVRVAGDPELLRIAGSRLAGLPVGDPGTHRHARDLLEDAARNCEELNRPRSM